MGEEVKLLKTWSSPFVWRVVWALKLKGVEYVSVEEDLSNKSPLLLQCNPIYKRVPVLIHNGKSIAESLIILEYIDGTWNSYPLLPEDPHDKATSRFWAKFADDKVLPSVWVAYLKQGKEQEEATVSALENLKYIEQELRGKKFFGGESIGFLDLVLGWLAIYVNVLEDATGLNMITQDTFPCLLEWIQSFTDLPLIQENHPPKDKLITKFQVLVESYTAKNAS
ncbi:hypothetical protein Dsin_021733 [Dipteronia sinensis]|uniref:glutathione transferase n=1 Tax=Dipteronia sinensis TaxID=43782 RepID=A0AAE0A0B9_9ROSI|nr:hypothetical protein Dsin_021733 [Dipteronia sinensis]